MGKIVKFNIATIHFSISEGLASASICNFFRSSIYVLRLSL